ncbi:MAG: TolC family protein [Acidobacteriota bacterium]|nr:TolC family protein [Acidobacteriota bacterium]
MSIRFHKFKFLFRSSALIILWLALLAFSSAARAQNPQPQTLPQPQSPSQPPVSTATPPPPQNTTTQQQTNQPRQNNPVQTPTSPQTPIITPGQNVGDSRLTPTTDLPTEPPPVAPNFEAPLRPLPSAERVGVDVMNQLPLTLDEAIRLALQNNNDVDSSRIDVQIAEFNLRAARGVYDPLLGGESYYERRTTPTASTIGGAGASGSITQSDLRTNFGATGLSPVAGGSYSVDFNTGRTTSNNQNALLNPQFPSSFSLTYTQPILRGRRFDINRRNIEIAKKNLSLSDSQFRQRVIEVVNQVEQAYWDLVYALRNLQVQIDAVKQARTQFESNQRLVAKGALAPIEIIASTTQITTFEQNVYTAQQDVTRAENTLKTLMLKERTSDIWIRSLTPVTPVEIEAPRVPLESAVGDAIRNRLELQQIQTSTEINNINTRFYREQTKPQVDLIANYTANGLAGTANEITRESGTINPDLLARINQLSANQGLPPLVVTPTTTVSAPPSSLVGGPFSSITDLLTARYPTYRVGVRISLPLGNRVAEAELGRSLAEGNRLQNQRLQQEQIIEAEVRNALQALRSAEARLASAAAARNSAELLYESEQRQFRAGTTTLFLVLQRQNELIAARGRELQAQTDLNKAVAAFQRATGTTLTVNNIDVK